MKKYILIILSVLLAFVACQKEDHLENLKDPDDIAELDEPMDVYFSCCDSLQREYHPGVEPTDFTFGNVEYWECPGCGKCYSEAKGDNEITEPIFLFPKQYYSCRDLLTEFKESGGESNSAVATAFTVISIIYTIYSSIAGIYRASLVDFNYLNNQLDELYAQAERISAQLNELARAIRVIPDRVAIMDRSEDLASLRAVNEMTRASIDSLKKMYPGQTEAEKAKLTEEIVKVYKDWGNFEVGREHKRPYELTESLLRNYFDKTTGIDYHTMYRNFVNSMCVWEHEGFTIRDEVLGNDVTSLTLSYSFTKTYYEKVRNFTTEENRRIAIMALDSYFNAYVDAAKSSHIRDSTINANYLILVKAPSSSGKSEVTYEKKITGPYNFWPSFNNHSGDYYFDYSNEDNRGVESCNKLLNYMSSEQNFRCNDIMTQDEAKLIDQIYNSTKPDKWSLNKILLYDCKFDCDKSIDFVAGNAHVIPERNNGAGRPRSESSSYKIFEWTAYRTGSSDHVGVYAVGDWNNNVQTYYKIAQGCRIKRSNGKIKDSGSDSGQRFYTVRKVK